MSDEDEGSRRMDSSRFICMDGRRAPLLRRMTGEAQSITFLVKEEMLLLRVDLAALVGVVEVESMVSDVRKEKEFVEKSVFFVEVGK